MSGGLEVSSVPSGGAMVSASPKWMSSVWLQTKAAGPIELILNSVVSNMIHKRAD